MTQMIQLTAADGHPVKRVTRSASNSLVIPIKSSHDRSTLELCEYDEACSSSDLHVLPPGSYVIHVFDSLIEARAARNFVGSLSVVSWHSNFTPEMSVTRLPGGGGAILTATQGVIRPDLVYEVEQGYCSFQVFDQRQRTAATLPISLSVEWDGLDLQGCEAHSAGRSVAIVKAMGRLIAETLQTPLELNLLQRDIQAIPGARVDCRPIGYEDVLEALEELVEELDFGMVQPNITQIHNMILRALRRPESQLMEKGILAREIARAYLADQH